MYIVETEQNGQSTQIGDGVATIAIAIEVVAERANIGRSITGTAPAFRLLNDGNPLTEAESVEWLAGAAANNFTTY
jgi:hypothetical protein